MINSQEDNPYQVSQSKSEDKEKSDWMKSKLSTLMRLASEYTYLMNNKKTEEAEVVENNIGIEFQEIISKWGTQGLDDFQITLSQERDAVHEEYEEMYGSKRSLLTRLTTSEVPKYNTSHGKKTDLIDEVLALFADWKRKTRKKLSS